MIIFEYSNSIVLKRSFNLSPSNEPNERIISYRKCSELRQYMFVDEGEAKKKEWEVRAQRIYSYYLLAMK